MHRIDSSGSVGGMFTDGQPGDTEATVVSEDWLNDVQENIATFIEASGAALVKGDYDQVLTAANVLYGRLDSVNTWTQPNTFDAGVVLGADDGVTFATRTQNFVTSAAGFVASQPGVHVISATGEGAFIRNTNGSGYDLAITAQLRATPGSTITALEIMGDTTGAAVNFDQIYLTAQDALTPADSTGYAATRVFISNALVAYGLGDVLKFRAIGLSPPGDATVPASGIVTLRLRLPQPGVGGATIDFHAAKLTTTRTSASLL